MASPPQYMMRSRFTNLLADNENVSRFCALHPGEPRHPFSSLFMFSRKLEPSSSVTPGIRCDRRIREDLRSVVSTGGSQPPSGKSSIDFPLSIMRTAFLERLINRSWTRLPRCKTCERRASSDGRVASMAYATERRTQCTVPGIGALTPVSGRPSPSGWRLPHISGARRAKPWGRAAAFCRRGAAPAACACSALALLQSLQSEIGVARAEGSRGEVSGRVVAGVLARARVQASVLQDLARSRPARRKSPKARPLGCTRCEIPVCVPPDIAFEQLCERLLQGTSPFGDELLPLRVAAPGTREQP